MMRWHALFSLIGLTVLCGGIQAQESANVEMSEVRFATVRDSAGATWWAGEVELAVAAAGGGDQARFAHHLQVELQLGIESGRQAGGFDFYRASASAAAVEAGKVVYRFYLPPAVVRRNRLERAPRFWAVQISVGGKVLPDSRRSVGNGFSGPEALANFRRQLNERSVEQDGVLLPWYLTPFANAADSPVPIRGEAAPRSR